MSEMTVAEAETEAKRLKAKKRRSWVGFLIWLAGVLWMYFAADRFDLYGYLPSDPVASLIVGMGAFVVVVLGLHYLLAYVAPAITWTWDYQHRQEQVDKVLSRKEAAQ